MTSARWVFDSLLKWCVGNGCAKPSWGETFPDFNLPSSNSSSLKSISSDSPSSSVFSLCFSSSSSFRLRTCWLHAHVKAF